MFGYVLYWFWWLGWRISVSLACIFTIQNVIHKESGIWIHTNPLLVASICLIIAIRIWSVKPDPHSIRFSKDSSGED